MEANQSAEDNKNENIGDYLDISEVSEDRKLTNSLIGESDFCMCCQNLDIPVDCTRSYLKYPNTVDKLGGWLEIGIIKTNGKKKKNHRRSADDALYLPFNEYESHHQSQRSQLKSADNNSWAISQIKPALPFWKSVVETDTYRYIPGNGRYRMEKSVTKIAPIKKKPERVYLTSEQRALQKEIQRDLRRELDSQKSEQMSNMDDAINMLDENIKNGPVKFGYSHSGMNKSNELDFESDMNARNKNSNRLKGLSQTFAPSLELPPITNQGTNYLDPFMEQVSKKLSALEEEMRRDSHIKMSSRKSNHDDQAKVSKHDKHDSRTDKKSKSDGIPADMFSVKQLMKNNEKKLKARTIQLKKSVDQENGFTLPSHVRYTTANGDVISIPIFSNVHAPNTTDLINQERQNFKKGADINGNNASSESLENTLQAVKCRVSNQQNISPIKRKHSNQNPETQNRAINNAFPSMPIGQSRGDKSSTKNFHSEDSYPDLLPKISGKRLEIALTTHRL